jgi:hypothetical protein
MKKVIMRTAIIIIMYPPTFIKYTKHKQTLKQKQKKNGRQDTNKICIKMIKISTSVINKQYSSILS